MSILIKRILFSILIIVNCIVIFNLSAQDSEKSSSTSGAIVEKIINIISKVNEKVDQNIIKDKVTFIVRKCAHFSIYTLLGIWLINFTNTFKFSIKIKILICTLFGFLYALSDEIHQNFVNGRSPELRDVCIDTSGILFGILLVILVEKILTALKKNTIKII